MFLRLIDKHAPPRTIRARNKPSPLLNSQIEQQMFERDWLEKKAEKSGKIEDWAAYKKKKNFVNKELKRIKKDYYKGKLKETSGDQRETWKTLNELMGKKSNSTQINELQTPESISQPQEVANYLNTHFTEIGSKLVSEYNI